MTFEQIGQKLKAAREGQGLSLTQIWERTKIPMHHLQSMETGITDELPETVYVAGFIKRYADVVGLNGQALSEEYRRDAVSESAGNGNGHFPRAVKQPSQPVLVAPSNYAHKTRIETGPPGIMKMLVFPSLCAILIIGLLAVLLEWHTYSNVNQSDPSILSLRDATQRFNGVQPVAPSVPPPSTAPTQTATAPGEAPAPNSHPSTAISLTASKSVWLDVKAMSTGETLFNGFLEAGANRIFNDAQGVRVRAGNGGSVTFESGGGKSELLGAAGKVTERSLYVKGASASAMTTSPTTPADASATAAKPVKKPPKKPSDSTAAHKRYHGDESGGGRLPGEGIGGTRSIDVPYRYTEGRLDTDQ